MKCTCKIPFKIPPMELRFIKDQRDKISLLGGKMQMQGRDKKEAETGKMTNKER